MQTALKIAQWRAQALPPMLHPVPVVNLHVTLSFLGKVQECEFEELLMLADQIHADPIEMVFDQLGYWNKPEILWIGSDEASESIMNLAASLTKIRRRMALHSETRKYRPHLTIARRCNIPPPMSVVKPHFVTYFDRFTLFESMSTKSGIRYRAIQEWMLG